MNFIEAKNFILDRLGKELPKNLYYHGLHHTLDVCDAADLLARAEHVNGESLILLRTAALFHDCGFIKQYVNNEPIAVTFAIEHLPSFGYTPDQIKSISDIILSTRIPQRPQSHIEEIMCDADLDYLGRDDFFAISETLRDEWLAYGIVTSEEEFNRKQIQFFSQHQYFTRTSRELREAKKQEHLAELKKRI